MWRTDHSGWLLSDCLQTGLEELVGLGQPPTSFRFGSPAAGAGGDIRTRQRAIHAALLPGVTGYGLWENRIARVSQVQQPQGFSIVPVQFQKWMQLYWSRTCQLFSLR